MTILTERQTWKRKRTSERQAAVDLRKLTASQERNVRQVLAHLAVELGGSAKLAAALGMGRAALEKMRTPSRPISPRVVMMAARVAQVGIDDVLAARWKRHACEECGCVGAA